MKGLETIPINNNFTGSRPSWLRWTDSLQEVFGCQFLDHIYFSHLCNHVLFIIWSSWKESAGFQLFSFGSVGWTSPLGSVPGSKSRASYNLGSGLKPMQSYVWQLAFIVPVKSGFFHDEWAALNSSIGFAERETEWDTASFKYHHTSWLTGQQPVNLHLSKQMGREDPILSSWENNGSKIIYFNLLTKIEILDFTFSEAKWQSGRNRRAKWKPAILG